MVVLRRDSARVLTTPAAARLLTAAISIEALAAIAEGESLPVDAARLLRVRAVLGRWCAQRAGRALIGGAPGDTTARAVRREVNRLLEGAPIGSRPDIAVRGAALLSTVEKSRGIGTSHALRAILRDGRQTDDSYLGALGDLATRLPAPDPATAPLVSAARPRLVALFLLEPDCLLGADPSPTPRRATPATAPAPAPPADDPESAVTR